jgi:ketosteroid isomerase-like protein
MRGAVALLVTAACSAAAPSTRQPSTCDGIVSCGREQLAGADQALQRAVASRGIAPAFADALLDDASLLADGKGLITGKDRVLDALRPEAPFTWTMAGADVSLGAELGYTFGWTDKGQYAAIWRRHGADWKLEVFLRGRGGPPPSPPPAWSAPARAPATPPKRSSGATDTEFAALAKTAGVQAAFAAYAADDAVLFGPAMLFGRAAIEKALAGAPAIEWGPAAESAAQDLAYTIGPYSIGKVRGHYLTIWRLEADGSWRFVLDGGVRA